VGTNKLLEKYSQFYSTWLVKCDSNKLYFVTVPCEDCHCTIQATRCKSHYLSSRTSVYAAI